MNIKKSKCIIGIDEVGRGSLAGPVTVAAVLLSRNFKFGDVRPPKIYVNVRRSDILTLKDSKKLSAKQREIWFEWIKERSISYAIANVPPKIIDKINISNAANLAATLAFKKLLNKVAIAPVLSKKIFVFLDGGLYLGNKKFLNLKSYILNSRTIIKGDEKIPAISLASIVAKVSRDRLMKKLHKKYPRYDFINNVGYGTKRHISAIKKHGRLPIHRKSFRIK